MRNLDERQACLPVSVQRDMLNPGCTLPYGLRAQDVFQAMEDFLEFLGFVNQQLYTKGTPRLESFIMAAGFSSIVGEFVSMTLPKYCRSLLKNRYHNGHPDLIPAGIFPNDAVQYSHDGVEIKASRYARGWQGHNPEAVWLTVFHFASNTPSDLQKGIGPRQFQFRGVYAARLENEDWTFSGRSGDSRRTITASVTSSGVEKMKANWIYKDVSA